MRTDERWQDSTGEITGRTLVQEGPIWLIRCPIETIQTVTPITEWGIWDAKIVLNIEDWAGNYGIMPNGEHDNVLEFSGANELISFMQGDLVLRYKMAPATAPDPGIAAGPCLAQEPGEPARWPGGVGEGRSLR